MTTPSSATDSTPKGTGSPPATLPSAGKEASTGSKAADVCSVVLDGYSTEVKLADTLSEMSFRPIPTTGGKIGGEKFDVVTLKIPAPPSPTSNPLDKYFPTKKDDKPGTSRYATKGAIWGAGWIASKATDGAKWLKSKVYSNLQYAQLTEEEKKNLIEKFNNAWAEYKEEKELDIKNVINLSMSIPLKKDGKPDFEKAISFQVTIVKRGEDNKPIPAEKNGTAIDKYKKFKDYKGLFETETITLFEGGHFDSIECLNCVATAVENWTMTSEGGKRKTCSSLKELQELGNEPVAKKQKTENSSETSSSSKNNCWLHAMIQRALRNKSIKEAVKKIKIDDKSITFEGKSFNNLIKCIQECIECPENQKAIIENFAAKIRKDFGSVENSQGDPSDIYRVLEDFLEIKPFEITQIQTLTKLEGEDPKETCTKKDVTHTIQIRVLHTKGKIDVSKEITAFLAEKTEGVIDKKDSAGIDKKWEVKSKTILPKAKPSSITIEIANKSDLDADTIPLGLSFDPSSSKSIEISDSGNFEFNYATIHNGSRDGGHYYSIYKEDNQWYIYDDTQDQPEKAIDFKEVKKHLKHARILVYEEKSKPSEKAESSTPVKEKPPESQPPKKGKFSLFGLRTK